MASSNRNCEVNLDKFKYEEFKGTPVPSVSSSIASSKQSVVRQIDDSHMDTDEELDELSITSNQFQSF